jgi:hypothetical protein
VEADGGRALALRRWLHEQARVLGRDLRDGIREREPSEAVLLQRDGHLLVLLDALGDLGAQRLDPFVGGSPATSQHAQLGPRQVLNGRALDLALDGIGDALVVAFHSQRLWKSFTAMPRLGRAPNSRRNQPA